MFSFLLTSFFLFSCERQYDLRVCEGGLTILLELIKTKMDRWNTSKNVSFERWEMLWLITVFLLTFYPCQSPLYTAIFDVIYIYLTWFSDHHHHLANTFYVFSILHLAYVLKYLVMICMCYFSFLFAALVGFKVCIWMEIVRM